MRKKVVFLLLFLFFSLSTCYASSINEVVGAPTSVTPQGARLIATGGDNVYYNPSLLTEVENSVSIGVFYLYQGLDISLMKRDAVNDIAMEALDAGTDGSPYSPVPTSTLPYLRGSFDPSQGHAYAAVNGVFHLIPKWLTAGFSALVPIDTAASVGGYFVDEREANFSNSLHFEMYEDKTTLPSVSVALASKPTDWLSLGAGVDLEILGTVDARSFSADFFKADHRINASADINASAAPFFAVSLRPAEHALVTLTTHMEAKNNVLANITMKLRGESNAAIEKVLDINTQSINAGYRPLTITLGAALEKYKFNDLTVTAGFSLIYQRWSQYRNGHDERPQDIWTWNADYVDEDGDKGKWELKTYDHRIWYDTINVTAASMFEYKDHKWGVDLSFYKSPVPDQTGKTNYVDNDKIILGGGYSKDWVFDTFKFQTGVSAMVTYLIERETKKERSVADGVYDEFPSTAKDFMTGESYESTAGFQTNNPGYPGYTSSGVLLQGGVWIKFFI